MATVSQVATALADHKGLMRAWCQIVIRDISNNFKTQSFDGKTWPGRYPNQNAPNINVAGTVRDLNEGATRPKKRRFDRRPVLSDTGLLRKSVNCIVTGDSSVEGGIFGPAWNYANIQQQGGVSKLTVTDRTKKQLAKLLKPPTKRTLNKEGRKEVNKRLKSVLAGRSPTKTERAAVRKRITDGVLQAERFRGEDKEQKAGVLFPYRDKLGFLFSVDTLETNVVGRQFVGRTDLLANSLIEATELFFESV